MVTLADAVTCLGLTVTSWLVAYVVRRGRVVPATPPRPPILRPLQPVVAAQAGRWQVGRRFENWFRRTLRQSGLRWSETTATLVVVATAGASGAISWGANLGVWISVANCLVTLVSTLGLLQFIRKRRMRKFAKQLPTALELLARATQAGNNLEDACRMASQSSEEPLRTEFAYCAEQLSLGRTAARATEELCHRFPSTDLDLFSHTIELHERFGGKLAGALDRLATIIRDRSEFEAQLRSTTGIARMAIMIVLAIGLFVVIYMPMSQPEYFGKLAGSPLGQKLIAYAVISELIGIVWIVLTLNIET